MALEIVEPVVIEGGTLCHKLSYDINVKVLPFDLHPIESGPSPSMDGDQGRQKRRRRRPQKTSASAKAASGGKGRRRANQLAPHALHGWAHGTVHFPPRTQFPMSSVRRTEEISSSSLATRYEPKEPMSKTSLEVVPLSPPCNGSRPRGCRDSIGPLPRGCNDQEGLTSCSQRQCKLLWDILSGLLALSSTWVLLNGIPGELINHRRGLRQGDPVSDAFSNCHGCAPVKEGDGSGEHCGIKGPGHARAAMEESDGGSCQARGDGDTDDLEEGAGRRSW
jgi:hypothetical protein